MENKNPENKHYAQTDVYWFRQRQKSFQDMIDSLEAMKNDSTHNYQPTPNRRSKMENKTFKKVWVNQRVKEMEEKANVNQVPKYDIDGPVSCPEQDWETNERDDAYIYSLSNRLVTILYTL